MTPLVTMVSGSMLPPGSGTLGSEGHASCQRMAIASSPPTSRKNRLMKRNWMPMILWSVEKTYFLMNDRSSWCGAA